MSVFVTDEGKRGGRTLPLKKIADDACAGLESLVKTVFVFKRTGAKLGAGCAAGLWVEGRDVWADELMAAQRPVCPCARMDSEGKGHFACGFQIT